MNRSRMMEFTAELATKIAGIARNLLYERFGDDFVFDPIWVERKVDHDDEDYLELNIVFDGDQNKLDPGWTVGIGRRMRPALREIGVEEIPDHAFHDKNEWQETAGRDKYDTVRSD